jgi:hypothetical protein
MDILTESEIQEIKVNRNSLKIMPDHWRDSAYEILIKKIDAANEQNYFEAAHENARQ